MEHLVTNLGEERVSLGFKIKSDDEGSQVFDCVRQNTVLKGLDCSSNLALSDKSMASLKSLLLHNKCLTSLDLYSCKLNSSHCVLISEGLEDNETLKTLNLSSIKVDNNHS